MEKLSFDRNIVQFYGAVLSGTAPMLVLEYMEGSYLDSGLMVHALCCHLPPSYIRCHALFCTWLVDHQATTWPCLRTITLQRQVDVGYNKALHCSVSDLGRRSIGLCLADTSLHTISFGASYTPLPPPVHMHMVLPPVCRSSLVQLSQ